jgi:hypothetical protein
MANWIRATLGAQTPVDPESAGSIAELGPVEAQGVRPVEPLGVMLRAAEVDEDPVSGHELVTAQNGVPGHTETRRRADRASTRSATIISAISSG